MHERKDNTFLSVDSHLRAKPMRYALCVQELPDGDDCYGEVNAARVTMILIFYLFRIQDSRIKKAPDPQIQILIFTHLLDLGVKKAPDPDPQHCYTWFVGLLTRHLWQ
jgi:hypothetical protein